jgi:hypothetical protein
MRQIAHPTHRRCHATTITITVALLLAVAARAQPIDDGALRLAERFFDAWGDPAVSSITLVAGALPDGAPDVPLPADATLVGGLGRYVDGQLQHALLVLDHPAGPEGAFAQTAAALAAGGWLVRRDAGPFGFVDARQSVYANACGPAEDGGSGWVLFVQARPRPGGHSELRLEANPPSFYGPCDLSFGPWQPPVPLPTLVVPEGTRLHAANWVHGDAEAIATAVLRGPLPANAVAAHLAGELGAAGWRPLAGAAAVPHPVGSSSRWVYADERGAWVGHLTVGLTVLAGDAAVEAPLALVFAVVVAP